MYQFDLSVLCSLRRVIYERKYPSLSLAYKYSKGDGFINIVRYNKKSIHIQIQNVDQYYVDNKINYARLFCKEKRCFSVNNYLDKFVKHLISESDNVNDIEYIVIYTNSGLDLTEDKQLKLMRCRNFYPFKFNTIDIEECDILKDFLFTNNDRSEGGFYQFSQDEITKRELLNRLQFSLGIQVGSLMTRQSEKIKEMFVEKLIFAVNQPSREELNTIIRNEIEKNSEVEYDYTTLQSKILYTLTEHEQLGKSLNHVSGIIYEFNLLMVFLHGMFLHETMSFINSESHDIYNDVSIHYEDKVA